MTKKKTIALIAVVGLVMMTGVALGLGELANQTETTELQESSSMNLPQASGLVAPYDQPNAQALPIGENVVSRYGAATTLKIAEETGETNVTVVGESPASQRSYLSGVQNDDGDYMYTVASRVGDDIAEISDNYNEVHYNSASTVVIASPKYVRDYVGGAKFAKVNDHPLFYVRSMADFETINSTLQDLGVTDIQHTPHVPDDVVSQAGNAYSTTELSTGDEDSFINTNTDGGSTVYAVDDLQDVALALPNVGDNRVLLLKNSTHPGQNFTDELSGSEDINLVANEDAVPQNTFDKLTQDTSGDVTRISHADQRALSARLALEQNSINSPLVLVEDSVEVAEFDENVTVRFTVTNIGFTAAKDIMVTLPRQGATLEFTETQPESSEGDTVTWQIQTLQPGEQQDVEYVITGASGEEFQHVPEVQSYANTVGTTFEGFSAFGQIAAYAEDIKNGLLGLVMDIPDTISGVVGSITGSPSNLAIAIGLVIALGAVVFIYYRMRRE